jgi:peroxiredoxin
MRIFTFLFLVITLSVSAFAQQSTGSTAQNFSVSTINDEAIELEQLKGKIVVMTFWSTRCQICAEEIPDLNRLVDKYSDDVVFLGLAWQDKRKLDVFLKKKPFKFKIVPQSFGVLLKYASRDKNGRLNMGFPAHFIVDQNGIVVYKAEGFDKKNRLTSTIDKLLRNAERSVAASL